MILLRSVTIVAVAATALPQQAEPSAILDYGALGLVFALAMALVRVIERLIDRMGHNSKNGTVQVLQRVEAALNATTTALALIQKGQQQAHGSMDDVVKEFRETLRRIELGQKEAA
jgi:hypothetical protein